MAADCLNGYKQQPFSNLVIYMPKGFKEIAISKYWNKIKSDKKYNRYFSNYPQDEQPLHEHFGFKIMKTIDQ